MDWNSDGTALAFVLYFKGLMVYNMTTNTTSICFSTSNTSLLHAVDWSPNDKMIAFSISNQKTIIIDAITKVIIS